MKDRTKDLRSTPPQLRTAPLSALVDVNPPRSGNRTDREETVSFIPMADVTETGRWIGKQTREYGEVCQGFVFFEEGDVLFAKITPCMENGKGCHATGLENAKGFGSTEFHVLRAREGADAGFVYQWSTSQQLRGQARNVMTGSAGQQRVPKEFFDKFLVPFLPKPEQSKIAEILSTVDKAIEQTEVLIAKQQRIKTGLMQDLLTRGIDEHGNLRSEKTHKFKDSPLGRIPVEWIDKTLSEVYAEIPKNGIFKTAKEIGAGTLMIGQTSFSSNRRINYQLARRAKVSINELLSYGLQENDILITRVYATVNGVGLPVLVETCPEPAVYESNMLRLRVDADQILPSYAFYWLVSAPVRTFVIASVNASNQTSINQKVIDRIPISLPTKPEQVTIVDILAKSEKSIEDNTASLRKLRFEKIALMYDLLAGKKRVTSVLNTTEEKCYESGQNNPAN